MNTSVIKSFSVKKRKPIALLLFMGVWLILAWAMVCINIYGFITDRFIDELAVVIALIALFSFFATKVFLWNLNGEESISFYKDYIEISKRGLPFFSTFKIPYAEYEGVDTAPDKTPAVFRIYGIAGGKLNIKYLGRTMRFGQSLDNTEALQLMNDIELTLKTIQDA